MTILINQILLRANNYSMSLQQICEILCYLVSYSFHLLILQKENEENIYIHNKKILYITYF